jgi:hypothetical protein
VGDESVQLEGVCILGVVGGEGLATLRPAGIVDQDVQPLPAGGRRRQKGVQLAGIGDVRRLMENPVGRTQLGGGLLQSGRGAGTDGQPAALPRQRLRDRKPQPAAGTGDNRDPVLETEVQLVRLGPACRR